MKPEYPNCEVRILNTTVEVRAEEGKTPVVRGHAAVFDKPSEDLGGFTEIIGRGAFADVLNDDVRSLWNHNADKILARTVSKTLRIGIDDTGLWYEYESPDTSYARDLLVMMKRGDVNQSSFAFSVAENGARWVITDSKATRYVNKLSRLYDVSPVTYAAYPSTDVALRSMKQAVAASHVRSLDLMRRRVEIAERE